MNPRWMEPKDYAEVLHIEEQSFDEPWTDEDLRACLRTRNCVGFVMELGHVAGYMVYELFRNRLHLMNLAVHPDLRRRGVGSALITRLVNKLSATRRERITAVVRETSLPALTFLRNRKFRAVRLIRNYYGPDRPDAIAMEYRL